VNECHSGIDGSGFMKTLEKLEMKEAHLKIYHQPWCFCICSQEI